MRLRRALVAIAAGKGLAFAAFVVAACTSAPSGPVTPGPTGAPPSTAIASSSTPFAPLLDAAWREGRHMCGEQSLMVVDHLAGVLMAELDAPMLDARIAAGQYLRDRCA